MTAPLLIFFSLFSGYLLGAIPFAVLIARLRGVDIFAVGSGNPGATNVLRVLGKPAGYACFILDALKGTGAVYIGFGIGAGMTDPMLAGIAGLAGAILGHSFSVFLSFRGGKGVATTIGGMLALLPTVMLIGVLVWVLVFYSSRYVSLASMALGVSLPLSALILQSGIAACTLTLLLAVLIILRHRSNIQRLIKGTENRVARRQR